jgi:hypothetical protein
MRVKAGQVYVYQPALLDMVEPRTALRPGEAVRVVRCRGCPPPNTMGHAHVETLSGIFAGLVQTASLCPATHSAGRTAV